MLRYSWEYHIVLLICTDFICEWPKLLFWNEPFFFHNSTHTPLCCGPTATHSVLLSKKRICIFKKNTSKYYFKITLNMLCFVAGWSFTTERWWGVCKCISSLLRGVVLSYPRFIRKARYALVPPSRNMDVQYQLSEIIDTWWTPLVNNRSAVLL